MAVIKCKMCAGNLKIIEGVSTAECEYCGSVQTIPKADDEKKLVQFERAERLRKQCEFDKAAGIYESIVADFRQEAEAYWGLVLCKYGIEYVDDPATSKKIPTCHRSSFDSIFEDNDFEQALENADVVARKVYREEAKAIEEIRKGIIAVSANEEPYDIFICYKETDENGDRTLDSVLAQDVYDALADKGYRVFFSRITLEEKLGVEYEPYIFAALNSAKVMLAFGTDYEYFNAVWVKNEWSRFLKLMAKDKEKHLIPCYKGIDAYDMPSEFAKLQAQDLGKVGAMQDLLRGIEKLLPRQKEAVTVQQQMSFDSSAMIESYLKRVSIFLSDEEWKSADEYCEKVLDIDPENAKAYVGKLLAELHIEKQSDLQNCEEPFDGFKNYQKAVRFADEILRNTLEGYIGAIKARKAEIEAQIRKSKEEARLTVSEARKRIAPVQNWLSAGEYCTAALCADGTVLTTGLIEGDVENWRDSDIVAVSVGSGYVVGLRSNGTVVTCGRSDNYQCNVEEWRNIVAVSVGEWHTVGLCADGTVVAVGSNDHYQYDYQRDMEDWRNIVAVSAGEWNTAGLCADGTVVATAGYMCQVKDWRNIVAVSAGASHIVGLCAEGRVVAVGSNDCGECNVQDWRDIVAVSAGCSHTVGLCADGTVVAVGDNDDGQCDVEDWRDIVAVSAGMDHTVGLRSDGTLVTTGYSYSSGCQVDDWQLFESLEDLKAETKTMRTKEGREAARIAREKQDALWKRIFEK